MLGGGLSDGTICIWNPARIIESDTDASKAALMCRLNKHQGAVRGLAFNPYSAKLLASGAADGEVCIWDLSNPSQPSLYPAMKGGAAGSQNPITCLQWNPKVQHILATGTSAGSVVVWDLKKQRPVISFTDSGGRRRCSSIAWNPDIATQVMVASDDDASPSLQLWDLRNANAPLMELHGHSKGVCSLDWSPHDSSMLLSSGKDNKIVVWDMPSRQPRHELLTGPNWKFEVQWSNAKQPGIFAGASFEGLVSLHSIASCATAVQPDGQPSVAATTKPASWEKKPVAGASFGFGGKLLRIVNAERQMPSGEVVSTASGKVDQIQLEGKITHLSPEFEQIIRNADRDSLKSLCGNRAGAAQDPQEEETWMFLQTHFEADSKKHLLCRLGFESLIPKEAELNPPDQGYDASDSQTVEIVQEMAGMAIQQHGQAQQLAQHLVDHANDDGSGFFSQSPVDGDSFFENLSPHEHQDVKQQIQTAAPQQHESPKVLSPKSPKIVDGIPGENELDIQKAIYAGNYESAVSVCLNAKRFSDALVIASMVGGDVWEKTRKDVMTMQPRPYMRVIHSTLDGDWDGFVRSRPPQSWRETLATLLTSAPYDRFVELVGVLASRLESAGAVHPALLCNICSGNVENAVRLWNNSIGKDAPPRAQEAVLEKAVVLGLGVDGSGASSALGDLLARQAEELASSGRLEAAYNLLLLVPSESSEKANDLRDRLYQGGATEQAQISNAQGTDQGWASSGLSYNPEQLDSQSQQMYGAMTAQQVSNQYATAPPQQKQSPTATPYSMSSGGYPYESYRSDHTFVQQQPQVFTPAQPQQSAPPTGFASTFSQPPTTFQPQASPAKPLAPSYLGTSGGISNATSPRVPGSPHSVQSAQPPQVYQHGMTSQPPSSSAGYGAGMSATGGINDYAPSSVPAHVFKPPTMGQAGPQQAASMGMEQVSQTVVQPSAPPAPVIPSGPPPDTTLMNVGTEKIPAHLSGVVQSLKSLYQGAEAVVGGQPARRRELEDASKKLGLLIWKMNEGQVSSSVSEKLQQLCRALDAHDFARAAHIQVMLTTSDWDECSSWLTALKRLIKLRQISG